MHQNIKQQFQYLRKTLYKDLVSSPLHLWLLLYLLSLAFTNVRIYAGVSVSELVFIMGLPMLLYSKDSRTWFASRPWYHVLNKVALFHIAAVMVSIPFAICDQTLVTGLNSFYFYLLFLIGYLFFQLDSARSVRVLTAGLSLAGFMCVLVSVFGILWSIKYQENSLTAWYYQDYPYFGNMARARGFLSTPTMMALLVGTGLLLKLPFFLVKDRNKILGFLLLIDITGLLMTSSKVILTVLAGVAVILFYRKIVSKLLAFSFIAVVSILLVISTHFLIYEQKAGIPINPKVTGDLIFQLPGYDVYASSYLELKKGSLKAIADMFPFGTGPGCHFQYIDNLISKGEFSAIIGSGNAHSVYTGTVAELGMPGLIFLGWLIVSVFASLRILISADTIYYPHFVHFLVAFFIFFGIAAFCSDLLSQRYFWVVLGALAGLSRFGKH